MKRTKYSAIILGATLVVVLTGCASVIKPGQAGMMWKPWGKGLKTEKIYNNGLVWKWPWTRVIKYNVQWKNYTEKVDLLTADELHITVTVSVVLRPSIEELPLLELEVGRNYYASIVKPEIYTVTRSMFAKYIHGELSVKSPQIEKEILIELNNRVKDKHLDFDNVTLDHIMYSPLVTDAVEIKLATKQKIEQKDYEIKIAEKDAEIQRIRAQGQKDAEKIIDQELTSQYLQFKALEVQGKLSESDNAKFFFVPIGENGLPIIVDTGSK